MRNHDGGAMPFMTIAWSLASVFYFYHDHRGRSYRAWGRNSPTRSA
jgi:hypothetical protein